MRELIGSSNPIARFGRDLSSACGGVFIGFVLLVTSVFLTYQVAHQKKLSKVIESLPLQEASSIDETSQGMMQIHGTPEYLEEIIAPNTEEKVLTYTLLVEEYAVRRVEKTRTITENGNDYRETYYEYQPDWETVKNETDWADFKLGSIEIHPDAAKARLNASTLFEEEKDTGVDMSQYLKPEDKVGVVQNIRTTVTGVPADEDLIVVGEKSGNKISSGAEGAFFVSNMSAAEFLQAQKLIEKVSFWGMLIGAWILMTLGFTMLFGPIVRILDIVPILGTAANFILLVVFGLFSAVLVGLGFIGFKFWWVLLILGLLAFGFWIQKKLKSKNSPGK